MKKNMKRLGNIGVVPVVVIENKENAVPTAKALLAGGVDVMEITFRTAAAQEAIQTVTKSCPEILVGAGTVLTLEQCYRAVKAGARFIVSPGFDAEIVDWCLEHDVAVIPGCTTPTEIMAAVKREIYTLKYFPANIYGGLAAMKALSGPFGKIKFIPTGGVNKENLEEYIRAPFVFAVGGSWMCTSEDIIAGNFEKITKLCAEARKTVLGFEMAHVGINAEDAEKSLAICQQFSDVFGFAVIEGNHSNFAGTSVEAVKGMAPGECGHIAVGTNSISRAAAHLETKGFYLDMSTAKYKSGKLTAVYLRQTFGGFAVHLLQK